MQRAADAGGAGTGGGERAGVHAPAVVRRARAALHALARACPCGPDVRPDQRRRTPPPFLAGHACIRSQAGGCSSGSAGTAAATVLGQCHGRHQALPRRASRPRGAEAAPSGAAPATGHAATGSSGSCGSQAAAPATAVVEYRRVGSSGPAQRSRRRAGQRQPPCRHISSHAAVA